MYQYSAKVIRVVDGDTIDAEVDLGFKMFYRTRFRLFGINTPERTLRSMLQVEGKDISIKTLKDKTGKYGRYLAIVTAGAVNINEELVKLGLAEVYKE